MPHAGPSSRSSVSINAMRRAAVLVMVGCSSPTPPPSPITSTLPAAPADAPVVSAVRIDLGAELKAIATARVPKPIAYVDPGIYPPPVEVAMLPAFGPCTRPDDSEQAKLRARVEAWVRTSYPLEGFDKEGGVTAIGFGCVDRAGVIVDITVDTWLKKQQRRVAPGEAPPGFEISTPPSRGRWLTVRVAPAGVTTLIETTGIPSTHGGEWAWKTTQKTLALADLDRDGVFDVISVHEEWDVGNVHHHLGLTTVLGTGAKATFGTFGDYVELAPQPRDANRAVVIRIKDDRIHRVILRCVDGSAKLATTCPELPAAQRLVDAELAAETLAGAPVRTDFDRDEVTELVALLEVPEPKRAALIAAAPVVPSRVVAREVARFGLRQSGADVLLLHEREARRIAEEDRQSAAAFAELGDTECAPGTSTPALETKVAAWVTANDQRLIQKAIAAEASMAEQCKAMSCSLDRPTRPTLGVPCAVGTKRYVIASWRTTGRNDRPAVVRSALLFVDGDRLVHVIDAARMAAMCCTHGDDSFALDVGFYRRADKLMATVLPDMDPDRNRLVTVVDGVVGERRTGDFERYPIRPLIVDQSTEASIWHAGPALHQVSSLISTTPVPRARNPLEALIFERTIRESARTTLESFDGDLRDADTRADTIELLTLLGAPKDLVERVRATR